MKDGFTRENIQRLGLDSIEQDIENPLLFSLIVFNLPREDEIKQWLVDNDCLDCITEGEFGKTLDIVYVDFSTKPDLALLFKLRF